MDAAHIVVGEDLEGLHDRRTVCPIGWPSAVQPVQTAYFTIQRVNLSPYVDGWSQGMLVVRQGYPERVPGGVPVPVKGQGGEGPAREEGGEEPLLKASLPYMSRFRLCPRMAESGLFVSLMSCERA